MGGMSGVIHGEPWVVPADATTLPGFRAWRRTLGEDAPRVDYVDGNLWFDVSPQNHRTHLPVTSAINATLWTLARDQGDGRYCGDGGWITHAAADLSTEPDGFYVRYETLRAGAIRLAAGSEVELEGRPDMVLEVVSKTSLRKDAEILRAKYAQAEVPEFWLIDAQSPTALRFDLLQRVGARYVAVEPDASGYRASPVWGRAFRLRRITDPVGQPDYRLDVR